MIVKITPFMDEKTILAASKMSKNISRFPFISLLKAHSLRQNRSLFSEGIYIPFLKQSISLNSLFPQPDLETKQNNVSLKHHVQ